MLVKKFLIHLRSNGLKDALTTVYRYSLIKTVERPMMRKFVEKIYAMRLGKPYQIVMIDGGICSQIYQYYLGQILESTGLEVKYDLSFFNEWGLDIDGKEARRYELNKLFPYLNIDSDVPKMCYSWLFRYLFLVPGGGYIDREDIKQKIKNHLVKPSLYGEYYKMTSLQTNEWKMFYKRPEAETILDVPNMELYKMIMSCKLSVGVHIRRGDLAEYRIETGYFALDEEYFIRTMNYKLFRGATFFIFSNEIEWFKTKVLPRLTEIQHSQIHMVTINKKENAYYDLYLLGSCMYQIASQGSFGRVAYYLLNHYPEKRLIRPVLEYNDELDQDGRIIYCNLKGECFSESDVVE